MINNKLNRGKELTGEELREGMRLFPSPVTVITAGAGLSARGITIGSFTSSSLDPPLVTFNVSHGALFHSLLSGGALIAVHILGDNQAMLSNRFARPDLSPEEQFRDLEVTEDENGLKIVGNTLGVFTCRIATSYDAGDHTIVVARVISFDPGRSGSPLIYYNQGYRQLGSDAT